MSEDIDIQPVKTTIGEILAGDSDHAKHGPEAVNAIGLLEVTEGVVAFTVITVGVDDREHIRVFLIDNSLLDLFVGQYQEESNPESEED